MSFRRPYEALENMTEPVATETLLARRNNTSRRPKASENACVQKVGSVDVSGVLDQRGWGCGCPTSNGVLLFHKPLLPRTVRVLTR